jgi:hypothetical protein
MRRRVMMKGYIIPGSPRICAGVSQSARFVVARAEVDSKDVSLDITHNLSIPIPKTTSISMDISIQPGP